MSDVIDLDAKRRQPAVKLRQFTFEGQTFTFRTKIRPDVRAAWEAETDPAKSLVLTDDLIKEFLVDEDHARWDALRARTYEEGDPIGIDDMLLVVRTLFEVTANRPTTPSSDSSSGLTSDGT